MPSTMPAQNSHSTQPTITEPARCYAIPNYEINYDLWSSAWSWHQRNSLCAEVHIMRIRYWIPERLEAEFLLRYGDTAYRVPEEDYV